MNLLPDQNSYRMDHLTSSEERRARWYSQLQPRFVSVQEAQDWNELLPKIEQGGIPSDHVVTSVPMHFLRNEHHELHHDKLRAALQHHGFLVISNVLSEKECQDALRLAWDWVKAVVTATNEERRSMATYDGNTPFPKSIEGGIIPFYGSGHSSFAWTVRSHPNVIRVFQCIWDCCCCSDNKNDTSLISSLDGIVLWQTRQPPTDAGWFHVDQNPQVKPGFESVQGLVNLLPVTTATGGNALIPQSHDLFPHHYTYGGNGTANSPCHQFYVDRLDELHGDDWMEIDPNDTTILSPDNIISCLLGPGDMLLWDSRLVHCSYPGVEASGEISKTASDSSISNYGLCRAATMVSMMPQSKCSLQVLQQRRQAVTAARTLTHWANKVAPLGSEHATDERMQEEACIVAVMKKQQELSGRKILLDFDDLNATQRKLVVGDVQEINK